MKRMFPMLLALGAAACGGDDEVVPDGATPPPPDATPTTPDAEPYDPVARGEYLVTHVSVCVDCHSGRNMDGSFDPAQFLSGVECFVDIDPMTAGFGCIHSRNLTNHPTGLMNRTDEEIKTMFRDGMRPGGQALHPFMPYWVFHNMTDQDADAIVAYLRTVQGVDHMVPPNEAPFDNVPAPAPALDPADIPMGAAGTDNGRYLASMAGLCIECHTEDNPPGPGIPINTAKLFQGGKEFPSALFGLPVPPFPDIIYSFNITPDATTGIGGRTTQQIVDELKLGVDPDGAGICPPMPAGPMQSYGGLTDEDAAAIADYVLSIPAATNMIPNTCAVPGP